jgi:peptidoglycan hydrolase CwlO-like protein
VFRSKLQKLELELRTVNAQIRAYEASDNRDLLLMEIQQINEQIVFIKNKINENQGFYDYARNLYTNGSNRLAGRLLMNLARKA